MLAENCGLLSLDLQSNFITSAGMNFISDGLAVNKTLTVLCLQWNSITNSAVGYLADQLSQNKSSALKALCLLGNEVDPEMAGEVVAAVTGPTPLLLDVSFSIVKRSRTASVATDGEAKGDADSGDSGGGEDGAA